MLHCAAQRAAKSSELHCCIAAAILPLAFGSGRSQCCSATSALCSYPSGPNRASRRTAPAATVPCASQMSTQRSMILLDHDGVIVRSRAVLVPCADSLPTLPVAPWVSGALTGRQAIGPLKNHGQYYSYYSKMWFCQNRFRPLGVTR